MELLQGDCLAVLKTLPDEIAQTCVTSPPYWGLRDYGVEGQLGLEKTPEEYVGKMVEIFREVRRVLKKDGTLWLNLGDSYAGSTIGGGDGSMSGLKGTHHAARTGTKAVSKRITGLKAKDLVGIPWMVAFALRADGWWLRSDIIWSKPNCMPSSVTDRPTTSHEYLFLLAKSGRYFYAADKIKEQAKFPEGPWGKSKPRAGVDIKGGNQATGGPRASTPFRNKRTVWTVSTTPYKEAHFATYPPKLIRPCVLAGSGIGDLVLDPFNGAGTTGLVALELRRRYLGIEINPDYLELTRRRLEEVQLELFA